MSVFPELLMFSSLKNKYMRVYDAEIVDEYLKKPDMPKLTNEQITKALQLIKKLKANRIFPDELELRRKTKGMPVYLHGVVIDWVVLKEIEQFLDEVKV